MLSLQKNIENEEFSNLLDICLTESSYFTFTENRWSDINIDIHNHFLSELLPFYLKTINTQHWFCMNVLKHDLLKIHLYKSDKRVKAIVQKYHDNLFFMERNLGKPLRGLSDEDTEEIIRKYFDNFITMEEIRENDKWGNTKDLPEDICFFIDDKLFLGTVSHENICEVYPPSEAVKKQLLELGEWEEAEDDKEQQIILNI